MDYQAYPFHRDRDYTHFQFVSKGKKGVVSKHVFVEQMFDDIYNLALTDFDPKTKTYSDSTVSDNGDVREVLSTVMSIAKGYLHKYPDRRLYFTGSSTSRTRLYQIVLTNVFNSMSDKYVIFGKKDNAWYPFEPNMGYDGFLIGKKS